jgi:uncharacterized protein with LGFP repeats
VDTAGHVTAAVQGPIYVRFLAEGGEGGTLGEPTGGEYAVPDGRRIDFARGSLTWSAVTGVVTLTRS